MSAGRMCAAYVDVGVICERSSKPIAPMSKPVSINGRGPIFGISVDETPANAITPNEKGKKAKPDFNGEYPSTRCK